MLRSRSRVGEVAVGRIAAGQEIVVFEAMSDLVVLSGEKGDGSCSCERGTSMSDLVVLSGEKGDGSCGRGTSIFFFLDETVRLGSFFISLAFFSDRFFTPKTINIVYCLIVIVESRVGNRLLGCEKKINVWAAAQ